MAKNTEIPETTYLYISKPRMYFRIAFGIIFIAFSIFLYFNDTVGTNSNDEKQKLALFVGPVLALIFIVPAVIALRKTEPQLILNNKGIQIAEKPLMLWEGISEIKVIWGRNHELNFRYNGKMKKFNFHKLNVKPSELNNLINTYKERYLKSPRVEHIL